jgi:hypothetical protein
MDNEQRHHPGRPIRDPGTAGPSNSGSNPQAARNKGLAWVSAITLGAGAASTVGALAIAVSLASPTLTSSLSSAPVASTPNNTLSDAGSVASNSSEGGDDDGAQSQAQAAAQPQLQQVAPPSNTNNPPAATSGAS